MNDQFLFPDMCFALEEPLVTSLLFAVLPDKAAIEQIIRCACAAQTKHGLKGNLRPTGRLHATLYPFTGPPHEHAMRRFVQIGQMAAAKAVKGVSPFEVRFDRVKSFSHNRACVLVDRGGNVALRDLISRLKGAMSKSGSYTPHVTMFYDDAIVQEEDAAEPVIWRVNEIVLLQGIPNQKTFQELGRWTLQG
jgi:2'-5' RNA ligase